MLTDGIFSIICSFKHDRATAFSAAIDTNIDIRPYNIARVSEKVLKILPARLVG
jgi:hypothetical protein